MLSKRGFTLIELMVVILIVAILAAVAIPIMRGRIDAAKWTEGKAMAGTLSTALRAFGAEHGADYGGIGAAAYGPMLPNLVDLGFENTDLEGTYFVVGDYAWITTWDAGLGKLTYTITVKANALTGIKSPSQWDLDSQGNWTIGGLPGGP